MFLPLYFGAIGLKYMKLVVQTKQNVKLIRTGQYMKILLSIGWDNPLILINICFSLYLFKKYFSYS